MEIKYEAVFGSQELFDGAPEDAEYAGWFCQEVRWYMILNSKILFSDGGSWCTSDNPYLSADIAAMRRIIRTPTWTVADQKAGKSPEVGSMLNHKTQGECTFIGTGVDNKSYWALKLKNDLIYIADKNWCAPIETPEEKAARLREEWCRKCTSQFYPRGSNGFPEMIYDALLTGDLPVPSKDNK